MRQLYNLKYDRLGGEVPVEEVARLGGHNEVPLLVDDGVGDDGPEGRVGQPVLHLAYRNWSRAEAWTLADLHTFVVRK